MTRSGFLLLTLCLIWTTVEASSVKPVNKHHSSSRFAAALEATTQLLWKSFSTETRIQDNFLLFPVPFARDVIFIDSLLNEEAKGNARKLLPLYKGIEEDLRNFGDEIRKVLVNDTRFKTILYANSTELHKTLEATINPVYKNSANPKESFQMIVISGKNRRRLWKLLSQSVEDSKLGVTCEVRFCKIRNIVYKNPSFAMVTLASWRIRHVAGFQWSEMTKFFFYETYFKDVRSLRSVAKYDYAEFPYSHLKGCTGRALRIPYNSKFHLTFVIPLEESNCSAPEELWKNVEAVDLNGLKYKNQVTFVSLPVFSVSANMKLSSTLKGTPLAKVFASNSSKLYKAVAFLAAEFIFEPKLPASHVIPMISPDTPAFLVDRPFFLSISHISSRATVFAGLILYPGCIKECHNKPSIS